MHFSKKVSFLTLLNSFCCHSNTLSSMSCILSCTFCNSRLDPSCSCLPCGTKFDDEILLNLTLEWKNTSTYKKNITATLLVIMTIQYQVHSRPIWSSISFLHFGLFHFITPRHIFFIINLAIHSNAKNDKSYLPSMSVYYMFLIIYKFYVMLYVISWLNSIPLNSLNRSIDFVLYLIL